jgi:hypothetical protein
VSIRNAKKKQIPSRINVRDANIAHPPSAKSAAGFALEERSLGSLHSLGTPILIGSLVFKERSTLVKRADDFHRLDEAGMARRIVQGVGGVD